MRRNQFKASLLDSHQPEVCLFVSRPSAESVFTYLPAFKLLPNSIPENPVSFQQRSGGVW